MVSEYLQGLYEPVADEQDAAATVVAGEIPTELRGMYVRNGPNPRFPPVGHYHWFDGDGMVHGVALTDAGPRYVNRYVRGAAFAEETKAGAPLWRGLMEPFDPTSLRSPDKDTANTDLLWWSGRLLTSWYLGGTPIRLSTPRLETIGPETLGGTLTSNMGAHPKVDPRTGQLVFYDFSLLEPPFFQVGVANADGQLERVVPIELSGPRFFHDIAITENTTILLDLPMVWDVDKLRTGKRRIRFDPESPARFGVLPRDATTDQTQWFEVPACYIYHTINAYEDGSEIVLHACRVDNPMPKSREPTPDTRARLEFLELYPVLWEWRLDRSTGQARERQLDDAASEFPRINDDRLGVRTRHSYNPRVANEPTLLFDGIIKYDLTSGSGRAHDFGPDRFGDEPVFVARPGATEDDDGWLVTFVHDRREGTSELLIIDARNIEAEPVARIRLPVRAPIGFHAAWVPREGI